MGALTRNAVVNETIRVLIADGYPIFRDGLARLLAAGPGTELAGTAATGTEAVEMSARPSPT
jgi:DNA-binding NarL/FixJ family response regulator